MPIRILDAATVGRIAAGEVVERPSSVAKELFENSLDAKATSITVEIRSGGIEYLRVTDNGVGIQPNEVRLAFQNHATSKLQTAEELTDIRTMGFRGEALASISAVSKVELTTRRRGADSGVKAIVEGGRFVSVTESGCPEGTTVTVKDLFFNTPVRKAFLKKPNYEAGAVVDAVSRLLLGNPGISVRMISQQKTLFHSYGDGNLRHAALAVYGKEAAASFIEIDGMQGGLRVSGLIGVGDLGKPTRNQQSFFVNGRSIRCQIMTQAIENVAKGRVTIGMHPMCILNVTLPANSVDVNVHPNKLEVRFRDEESIRVSLDSILQDAFKGEKLLDIKSVGEEPKQVEAKPRLSVVDLGKENPDDGVGEIVTGTTVREGGDISQMLVFPRDKKPEDLSRVVEPVRQNVESQEAVSDKPPVNNYSTERITCDKPVKSACAIADNTPTQSTQKAKLPIEQFPVEMDDIGIDKPLYRIIGSAFDTYLMIQTDKALVMIDQHAAHERILYERYQAGIDEGTASQKLLLPLVIEVTAKELAQIENSMDLIAGAGFEVERFGEREIAIRAVPFVLGKAEVRPVFMEMLERLDQLKYAEADRRRQEIMQTACKHAVKGSQSLSDAEIIDLIDTMTTTQSPSTCPHGRPVLRAFTKTELDRMFKRIQ